MLYSFGHPVWSVAIATASVVKVAMDKSSVVKPTDSTVAVAID